MLLCTSCHHVNEAQQLTCSSCGGSLEIPHARSLEPARFWSRALAALLDGLIICAFYFVVNLAYRIAGYSIEPGATGFHNLLYDLITYFGPWFYYTILESSPLQGTFGKQALGLRVTDLQGRRVTFLCATWRYVGRFLSSLIFLLGYLMVLFTKRRQTLHDLFAGCLVLQK